MNAPVFHDQVLIGSTFLRPKLAATLASHKGLKHFLQVCKDAGTNAVLRPVHAYYQLDAQGWTDRPRAGRIRAIGAANPTWRNRQLMHGALHHGDARQIEIYGTAPDGSDTAPRPGRKEN